MALWDRRPKVNARGLVASAATIGDKSLGAAGRAPKRQKWQSEAWAFYDTIGEVHYACSFIAACFSRVSLRPGWKGDDDLIGPVFDDEGAVLAGIPPEPAMEAARLVRSLKHPLGGQPRLMYALGLNLSVAGELYVVGSDRLDATGGVIDRSWEVLSTEELVPKSEKRPLPDGTLVTVYERKTSGGAQGEELPLDAYPLRMWQAHPRFSLEADSMLRPVLEVCEELVLLTRGVRATTLSRLAGAGIVLIPNEITPPKRQTPDPEDDEADWFTEAMIEAMMTPIADKGSAAAVVPFVLRAPAEHLAAVRWLDFTRNFDSYPSTALRKEAVQRFAQGVDLPVEIVTGHQQTTFANAEHIDRSTFKTHLEPKLDVTTDGLTVGYMHPGLKSRFAPGAAELPEELSRFAVWYNATELVTPPDREGAALNLYDRYELSGATLRSVAAFSENDKPDQAEIDARIAIRAAGGGAASGAPAPTGPPGPPPPPETPTPPPNPNEPPPHVPTPGEGGPPPGTPAARQVPEFVARLHGAVEHAVTRGVERAGARLRSRLNGKLTATELRHPNGELAARLGPDAVAAICEPAELFDGEFEALHRTAFDWARRYDIAEPGRCADRVRLLTEASAGERLFDPFAVVALEAVLAAVRAP